MAIENGIEVTGGGGGLLTSLNPLAVIDSANIVGWWKLDETAGGTRTDLSSNGVTLQESGDISNAVGADNNVAMRLTGLSGFLEPVTSADNALFRLQKMTAMMMIRCTSVGVYNVIGCQAVATTPSTNYWNWELARRENSLAISQGGAQLRYFTSSGAIIEHQSKLGLPIGDWVFVAYTLDWDGANSTQRCYVNGVKISEKTSPSAPVDPATTTGTSLCIGAYPDGTWSASADMQHVVVADYALTEADVQTLAKQIGVMA